MDVADILLSGSMSDEETHRSCSNPLIGEENANDDQLQTLLSETERLVSMRADPAYNTKVQKKIDKVIKQADKYRKNKPPDNREISKFR